MREQVKIVGILQIVLGALGVLLALSILIAFYFSGALAGIGFPPGSRPILVLPIVGVIGIGLFLLIVLASSAEIVAGVGLLQFRPWAHILTIIVSAVNLLCFPIGTAVGVYGLWVMAHPETGQLLGANASTPSSQPISK